ncbi:MAG: ATP-dependent zinc metalloprotease FtsH [Bacteriovoracaceae bacterium]
MKPQQKTFAFWIILFLLFLFVARMVSEGRQGYQKIKFSEFAREVQSGKVESVTIKGDETIFGQYVEGYKKPSRFQSVGPRDKAFDILDKNGIVPNYEPEEKQTFLASLLLNWGPMILLIVIFYFFLRQIQAGGGKAMSFGKSRAKMLTPNDKKVTFDNVSGVEEAKEELKEVVDFLKDPKKYTALGGKIPKGVILVGPPGTGKTLLARAVAGEADVPFFSISGSDFVEMFVGVGASRVRDLFEQGKKHAPCIVFVDEIDAVGRHRGAGLGGGHDEREQTLNQLLVEMDGFESNEGVILIAATNRIDVLDPALLRPGRFDRRVTVGPPDVRGRLGILKVHTKNSPLEEGIDLEVIAKGTPGFTGADLANLVNEAALQAARLNKKKVSGSDFEYAKDKVLMGPERKSMVISDHEKRNTAYHEAGHTLVALNMPNFDPIHKVSVMPRGGALGVTQTLPDEDRLSLTTEKAENYIAFMMGGRCAEELIFGSYTNGASNDIERATQLAHNMVCSWGMSKKMGPRNFSRPGANPFGGPQGESVDYSEGTAREIDSEIDGLIKNNYERAMNILKGHKDALDRLAEALIVWETLDIDQIRDIVDGKDIGLPIINAKKNDDDQTPTGTAESSVDADKDKKDDGKSVGIVPEPA